MFETILTPAVLEALGVLVSTFLLVGITRAGHFLSQRFATDRQRAILERVETAARNAVLSTHQTFVERIKAVDGHLTSSLAADALQLAVERTKIELGAAGLAELRRVTDSIDDLLVNRIEAALLDEKTRGGL